jgi:hypothetical protein
MTECKIIKKEFIFPKENSPKKQWRYTYHCLKCDQVDSRWYRKGSFTGICRHCSKGGYSTDIFVTRSKEHYGDRYDYSKSVYKNKRTKIEVVCRSHGSFYPRAGDHMSGGNGCPKCAVEKLGETCIVPLSVWKNRLTKNHPNVILLSDNLGYHTRADFSCSIHGKFSSLLGNIDTYKSLCPKCRKLTSSKQTIRKNLIGSKATVYYVYIPSLKMYKIGVTIQKLKRRLNKLEFDIILTISYPYLQAIEVEYYLHQNLTEYKYKGDLKLLQSGNFELYTVDVKDKILELLGLYRGDSISKVI